MNKEKATLQNINTEKNNNPFEEIVMIVENAKERAYRKVNEWENTLVKKLRRHLMDPVSLTM